MKSSNTEVHGGGGLELVKPVYEPASSRPKPCASLKKPPNLARSPLLVGPRRTKTYRGQRSTIGLPSAFAESGAYPYDRALPGSPRQCSCLSCAVTPPQKHQIGSRNRRASGNTILSQLYLHRVSTDRLIREGSQLAASLEG